MVAWGVGVGSMTPRYPERRRANPWANARLGASSLGYSRDMGPSESAAARDETVAGIAFCLILAAAVAAWIAARRVMLAPRRPAPAS